MMAGRRAVDPPCMAVCNHACACVPHDKQLIQCMMAATAYYLITWSCGLLIFLAGTPGRRVLTPNTSILSHQFSWGSEGKAHELFATVKEFELTQRRMLELYKDSTQLDEATIKSVLLPPQDVYLSAEEALAYNICDHIG